MIVNKANKSLINEPIYYEAEYQITLKKIIYLYINIRIHLIYYGAEPNGADTLKIFTYKFHINSH